MPVPEKGSPQVYWILDAVIGADNYLHVLRKSQQVFRSSMELDLACEKDRAPDEALQPTISPLRLSTVEH